MLLQKRQLFSGGAIAVDMEAAGVAARTNRAGLPFCCIKVVTDRADESFPFDLNAMRSNEGRIARGKIVLHALTHPKVIPALLRLKRRTEGAQAFWGSFLSAVGSLPNQPRLSPKRSSRNSVPASMQAAVYLGNRRVEVQSVPTPSLGPDEILIRVESCGICHTDLKKIEYDLLPAPRIFGHETAGVIAGIGERVTRFQSGRPGCRISPHSLRRLFLLSSQTLRAVPALQKGWCHRRF